MSDEPRLLDQPPLDVDAPWPSRSTRVRAAMRDPDVRLQGLDLQVDGLGVDLTLSQHLQVATVEVPVALDAGIDHAAVQPGQRPPAGPSSSPP